MTLLFEFDAGVLLYLCEEHWQNLGALRACSLFLFLCAVYPQLTLLCHLLLHM